MSKLEADQIVEVVFALVGNTNPYGEMYLDTDTLDNLHVLTEVIDKLIYEVYKKTKYANRAEYPMKLIGKNAQDFLGYLVEEYGLNDYVREEE